MSLRYRTGDWHAAITPQGFALLPTDLSLVLVEGIWGRVATGAGLGGVLEALTGTFGTSLSTFPSFAVVAVSGTEARLAVRGPLEVTVQTADASTVTVSGLGVTTWSERVVTGVVSVQVAVDSVEDTGAWYPLADGIVPASAIRLTLSASPSGSIAVPLEPAAESSAAPEEADGAGPADPAPIDPPAEAIVRQPQPATSTPATPEPAATSAPAAPETFFAEDTLLPGDTAHGSAVPATTVSEPTGPDTNLIASVPGVSSADDDDDDDDFWGATIIKPLGVAAAADSASATGEDPVSASGDEPSATQGDHDGETITFAQLQALRGEGSVDTDPPPGDDVVSDPVGRLELSTGEQVVLDRPVVIGRRPRATRVTGGILPHLISVPSPQQDISRSHVEIRREGDATLVVDLDTTNGTVLIRTGAAPVRLHPGDATMIIDGDVIDLGDGITVTVRDIR